jgi:hypothetical protein
MTFSTSLLSAQEAHQIASSEPLDFHTRILIISAINTAVDADAFTATAVVSGTTESIRLLLLEELNVLGYTVDGTTTPGSWIITW